MNELKARFNALTDREQILVIISAVVVLIGVFYFAIWKPLNSGIDREQKLLSNQATLLTWVKSQSARAAQLRQSSGVKPFTGSLPQAVNRTTSRHGIAISRMQPQGEEELQVWVDEAEFNSVLAWLQALENMGVLIKQVDIAEADQGGIVRIRRLQLGKL
jgi:general secretion pathway protein M